MTGLSEHIEDTRKITIADRTFEIVVRRFANGCFVAISEGEGARLGALELSIKMKNQISSSTIIPPKLSGTFLTMLSEMAANVTNGIALVSVHLTKEVSADIVRNILSETRDILTKQKS